jgi:hypothetical protein
VQNVNEILNFIQMPQSVLYRFHPEYGSDYREHNYLLPAHYSCVSSLHILPVLPPSSYGTGRRVSGLLLVVAVPSVDQNVVEDHRAGMAAEAIHLFKAT